jgi:hypothetical protein
VGIQRAIEIKRGKGTGNPYLFSDNEIVANTKRGKAYPFHYPFLKLQNVGELMPRQRIICLTCKKTSKPEFTSPSLPRHSGTPNEYYKR